MTLQLGTLQTDITADVSGLAAANKAIEKSAAKLTTDMDKAAKAISKDLGVTEKAALDMAKAMGVADKQGDRLARGGLKSANNAFGQLGFQVQDAAVQLQGGTNAMVVLAQQGSQVAGIFGPGGAVIGAFIAVGAAIAGTLLPSLFSSKNATEDLEIAMEELDKILKDTAHGGVSILTEEMMRLTNAQLQVAASAGMIAANEALQAAFEGTFDAVEKTLDSFMSPVWDRNFLQRSLEDLVDTLGISRQEAFNLADAANAFRRNPSLPLLENFNDVVRDISINSPGASNAMRLMANDMQAMLLAAQDAAKKTGELEFILQDPQSAKGATTSALTAGERKREADRIQREKAREEATLQRRVAAIDKLGETELEAIQRQYDEREALIMVATEHDEALMIERLNKAAEAKFEAEQAVNDKMEAQKQAAMDRLQAIEDRANRDRLVAYRTSLSAMSQLANTANEALATAGAEGSKIADGLFLAQKAINVAQIISATQVAAANAAAVSAVGGPVGYFSTQGAILAAGYANAALVAGLSVGKVAAGRQFGGPIQPMAAHPINEAGTPEILNQAGRQYLLPTGKGGTIEPMGKGSGTGQANVTIISNGTPQTVTGTQVSRGEIAVMINDAGRATERRINGSLATGRGDTAASLQRGYKSTRNLR